MVEKCLNPGATVPGHVADALPHYDAIKSVRDPFSYVRDNVHFLLP
jgi:hypothetical protein